MARGPHPPGTSCRFSRAVVGLLLVAAPLRAAESLRTAEPPARPDVLLITVDTLRPDALGWIGRRNATPAIDGLAASGFRFPRAIATAPLTLPSHASMMTALLPRRHGVRDNGRTLPADGPETLAERLQRSGYETAAFVSGFPLAAPFGLDRGFGTYDDRFTAGRREALERPAEATGSAAAGWLRERAGQREPWFLWVHFYDPHDPYEGASGPAPAAQRTAAPVALRQAYDGEVRRVDAAIGALLAAAAVAGRPRLTIFAADHGESLGDHGESTHGFFVYQSTVEAPLTLSYPGRVPAGESAARVPLTAIAPTVLDLVGLDGWNDRDAASLASLWKNGATNAAPVAVVESRRAWHSYGWSPLEAIVEGDWKLIVAPKPELYDLASDPTESRNRIDDMRPIARRLERRLREMPAAPPAAARDDPETMARLRSLGYVGGNAAGGEPPAGLPDPKDRIELWNRLGTAEAALETGELEAALSEFDAVLAVDPANPFALARSADALARRGDDGAAIVRLERALAAAPRQAEIRRSLVAALHRQRRFGDAVPHWMELARQRPRDASAWAGLGSALGLTGRKAEAVQALARAAELSPESAELRIRLAFGAVAAGDRERAARELAAAAALAPGEFAHAGALGILLDDLGRGGEAKPWLERSQPGEGDFAEASYRLARQRATAGDTDGARAALARAVAADPRLAARARSERELAPLLDP